MTWPQYRRGECSIDHWIIGLSRAETELLSTLLIRYPAPVTVRDLIEIVYPDPDAEPECPEAQIVQQMSRLTRKIGAFRLENHGRRIGYRLCQFPHDTRVAA